MDVSPMNTHHGILYVFMAFVEYSPELTGSNIPVPWSYENTCEHVLASLAQEIHLCGRVYIWTFVEIPEIHKPGFHPPETSMEIQAAMSLY